MQLSARDRVPTELWLEIFSHLPYFTLHESVKLVSRSFHALVHAAKPHIHGLTPRQWTRILTYDCLTYADFLHFSAACRDFRQLVQTTQSDVVLKQTFRLPYEKRRSKLRKGGGQLSLHPIFERISISTTTGRMSLGANPTKLTTKTLDALPVMSENATIPAVTTFEFTPQTGHSLTVFTPPSESGAATAVTVRDIVQAIQASIDSETRRVNTRDAEGAIYGMFERAIMYLPLLHRYRRTDVHAADVLNGYATFASMRMYYRRNIIRGVGGPGHVWVWGQYWEVEAEAAEVAEAY
ncbi:hypothetical protein TWF696_000396 [Orbilia brochopaga]|uniref:F-box domain-containing protein n=1 Tax=Orbilia brochopaga TaxID=3140254 RepID=A0AAV9VB60_9PEZI